MKSRYLSFLLASVLATAGCQWLTRFDADRNAEFANNDHEACESQGYKWPGDAYVDCRRFRADDRRREQWMELQMARQQQQPHVGIRPQSPTEAYRPIREAGFHCFEATDADGESYVACRETGTP